MAVRAAAILAALALVQATTRAAEPNESFAARTMLGSTVRTVSDLLTPGALEAPDTFLGVKEHSGEVYFTDDNNSPLGDGRASGLGEVPTNSGSIDFCITGVGDEFFLGSHGESGDYKVFVDVYDFFDDLVDQFSETRTLEPGVVHDFSFNDFEWIGGDYDVYINNTVGTEGGDVDFFTFTGLTADAPFMADTRDPGMSGIDTLLGWFDDAGTLIEFDDDSAGGVLSLIMGTVPASGMLTFAVSGFGDGAFSGAHIQDDPYELRLMVEEGSLPGDFNDDSMVNGQDLAVWQANFGPGAAADADGDNDSDGDDLLVWQRAYGDTAAAAAAKAVPEPSGWALVISIAAGVRALKAREQKAAKIAKEK